MNDETKVSMLYIDYKESQMIREIYTVIFYYVLNIFCILLQTRLQFIPEIFNPSTSH